MLFRSGRTAVDVDDPLVTEADEVVDGEGEAAAVVDPHDVDGAAREGAGHRDDGDLVGEDPQAGHADGGGDHDEGLDAVAQEGLGGAAVVDRVDDGG